MKVWHDNLRPAPSGWRWAKTNAQAEEWLKNGFVDAISMDYDMSGEKGLALAQWMAKTKHLPQQISIHSQNEDGAKQMAQALLAAGAHPVLKPFQGKYAPMWVLAKLEAEGRLKASA